MTKVKVDLELLEKYFAEHYDFENNPGQYFRYLEYDLEESRQKQYSFVYDDISKLCKENAMQDHTDTFFNLFFISWAVKLRQDHIALSGSGYWDSKAQIQYKKELFTVFLSILKYNTKSLLLISDPSDSKTIRITNKKLLDKFETFILDSVAELYLGRKWDDLSIEIDPLTGGRVLKDDERPQVIYDVTKWMDHFGTSGRGAPDKTYFIKNFTQSIDNFIKTETRDFPSPRQRHSFIGKLGVIYGIFPKPNKVQAKKGDNYFAKTVENHLPKN